MDILNRLERRFGSWAIPNFALFIVAANAAIYVLGQIRPDFISQLVLDPNAVRHGEFWRLVTFLFIPPHMGFIWMLFWLLVFYQFSLALEQEWGEFRFCLFYLIGGLSTIIAAMWIVGDTLPNFPLNTTVFLAYASLFPNYELLLFFILPVKVKYLAAFTWLSLGWLLFVGDTATRVAIIASLVNYAVFFGPRIWDGILLKWEVYQNRKRFRS